MTQPIRFQQADARCPKCVFLGPATRCRWRGTVHFATPPDQPLSEWCDRFSKDEPTLVQEEAYAADEAARAEDARRYEQDREQLFENIRRQVEAMSGTMSPQELRQQLRESKARREAEHKELKRQQDRIRRDRRRLIDALAKLPEVQQHEWLARRATNLPRLVKSPGRTPSSK
jgi:hypothetical protein